MTSAVCCRTFLLLLSVVATVWAKIDNLKICVVGNSKVKPSHATKYCDLLEKSKNTPVTCAYEPDRLGCLWAVSEGKADFSVFEPEDLYFSTLSDRTRVLVVAEIKELKKKRFHYGTVVVVRRGSNVTSIKDLAGKRLCHPGLESGHEWSNLFAQYLEERVAPANCEEGFTIYEDRVKATSDFFGSACKAGPWVIDPEEDARLKKVYWNLCGLCDSGDCRVTEKYRGSGGSITCFKDRVGDILWAKYEDVKIHLASEEKAEKEYSLLCDDGSLMPVTTDEPCIWLAKPWQVVAANRKSATSVQKILETLKNDDQKEWQENLMHSIELYLQYVENVAVLRTPEDYLRGIPGYLGASAMSEGNCKPKRSVRLCLSSSVEHSKCVRMSKASSALAIRPPLECVEKINVTSCLKSVRDSESDVVVVPPDRLGDAVLKFGLKSILKESGEHFNDSYLTFAVVRKNSNIQLLADLRGKKACFSRENGIGWNSAVNVLREQNFIGSECAYEEGLLNFFREICTFENKNSKTCCPDVPENENEETKGFDCLLKGGCDVAFLDFNYLMAGKRGKEFGQTRYDVKTICPSEESVECHWSWSSSGYLMINPKSPQIKQQEIYSLFYQMGQFFGRNSIKNNAMLKIFGPFNDVTDVLFRDTSTNFLPNNRQNSTRNYERIVGEMKLCSGGSLSAFCTRTLTLFSLAFSLCRRY